jgi:hypothetical protein
MTATRSRRAGKGLLLAAMLLSLWPAAVAAELLSSGHVSLPRLALPAIGGAKRAAGGLELELAQRSLATEADAVLDDTPEPDVASRAVRLRSEALAWAQRERGQGHTASVAAAMRRLDDAIAACALSPSPATRLAFDQSLQSYDAVVSDGALI